MARFAWTDGEVTDQQLNTEHIKTMFKKSLFPPIDNVNQTHLKLQMDIFTTFLKQVENMQASQSDASSMETLKLFTNFISLFMRDTNFASQSLKQPTFILGLSCHLSSIKSRKLWKCQV